MDRTTDYESGVDRFVIRGSRVRILPGAPLFNCPALSICLPTLSGQPWPDPLRVHRPGGTRWHGMPACRIALGPRWSGSTGFFTDMRRAGARGCFLRPTRIRHGWRNLDEDLKDRKSRVRDRRRRRRAEPVVFMAKLVDTRPMRRHNADRGTGVCTWLPRLANPIVSGCPSWMHDPGGWSGGMPEWLKGTDCKSVGFAYVGSNPTPSTTAGGS